jgi:putative ABC transport system permease protein
VSDVRYALRSLARQPSYTLTAVVTLALGIAVNTIAFSLINALVLRPMPVPSAERVVRLSPVDTNGVRGNLFSYPDYLDYRSAAAGLDVVAAYLPTQMTAGRSSLDRGVAEPRPAMTYVVSASYFELTGIRASLGRVLRAEDDRPDSRSVVITEGFWRTRLGADPAVVGSTLVLNGTAFTVAGVAAPGFTEPLVADCWVPLAALPILDAHDPLDRNHGSVLVIARLSRGVSRADAASRLAVTARQLALSYSGRARPVAVDVAAGTFFAIDPALKPVIAGVMGVVGLVLFIACANAANLALARASSRRREIALRLAIGAGRARIVRQLLVEAMLIGLAAGGTALIGAEWALRALYRIGLSLAAFPWAIALDLAPDIRVYAWTTSAALLSGAALGLLPALQSSSPRLTGALHGEGIFDGRLRGTTLRHALVVAQVAASLVLLFAAGLLLRGLATAEALDLGFKTAGVVYADYDPRAARYTAARADAFNRALVDTARSLPGVTGVALTSHVPLHGGVRVTGVRLGGGAAEQRAIVASVSPDYFSVLQLPFVAGHGFEGGHGGPAVVVSEGLARRFWPGDAAVGKSMTIRESPAPLTVVGVVRDASNGAIWRDKELSLYLPLDAGPLTVDPRDLHILVRTTGDAAALRSLLAVRAAALAGDMRFLPFPLDELLRIWLLPSRIAGTGAAVLAVMALSLACVGLYGVLTFAVGERSRELGIRMALGADRGAVVRLILGDAGRLVGIGLLLGAACALPVMPILGRLLFGVSPFDAVSLTGAAAFLTAVALAAAYRPARRASRLEPLAVLRME